MNKDVSPASYDYQNREGILPISWNAFHGICKALAMSVYAYAPELILAIARGGFYPGTLLAHMLQAELYPVRLSRRVNDVVKYESPQWVVQPTASSVEGRRVLVIDEICDTGETLMMVKAKAGEMGAAAVRSAVLYSHTWKSSVPDYIGIITDDLLLNPWDREIVVNGTFQFHPEYVEALTQQGEEPDTAWLIEAPNFELAKDYS